MEILKKEEIDKAVQLIKDGEVVLLPSETSYGLCCDATNQEAVNKIFKVKNRDASRPVLVVVPTIEDAKKCIQWNFTLEQLATKYWPGALTIVSTAVPSNLVEGVISNINTVALRVTKNEYLKEISSKVARPIVSTSANLSGQPCIYQSKIAIKTFSDKKYNVSAILDVGNLWNNAPSTVVSIIDNEIKIIRQGELYITI